jgi:hypothetical protein
MRRVPIHLSPVTAGIGLLVLVVIVILVSTLLLIRSKRRRAARTAASAAVSAPPTVASAAPKRPAGPDAVATLRSDTWPPERADQPSAAVTDQWAEPETQPNPVVPGGRSDRSSTAPAANPGAGPASPVGQSPTVATLPEPDSIGTAPDAGTPDDTDPDNTAAANSSAAGSAAAVGATTAAGADAAGALAHPDGPPADSDSEAPADSPATTRSEAGSQSRSGSVRPDHADARDRLLQVLLTDPERALSAADDLQDCLEQLARLTESVSYQKRELANVARRLRVAGLTPAQVARLAGLGEGELVSLLAAHAPTPAARATSAPRAGTPRRTASPGISTWNRPSPTPRPAPTSAEESSSTARSDTNSTPAQPDIARLPAAVAAFRPSPTPRPTQDQH